MSFETIKFKIYFKTHFGDQPPRAKISIDDMVKFDQAVDQDGPVEFEHQLGFGSHRLTINRYNKTDKDQILILDRMIIDGVDIQNIIDSLSYNEPDYPKLWALQQQQQGIVLEKRILAETHFGHNGTWSLEFTSPFYEFLMDAMNGDL
jgi:hypothetical protein